MFNFVNAATTPLVQVSFEAMMPFLLEQYGNASQPYSFAREPRTALKWARETIADCIGAKPEEIYFTSGGTESDNWAIKSSALKCPILTSQIEHHAILNACAAMEQLGEDYAAKLHDMTMYNAQALFSSRAISP